MKYEVQKIWKGGKIDNYRVTHVATDTRVATCYLEENAEMVKNALNSQKIANSIIDDSILKKALEQWGTPAQLEMVTEECSELILAIQKLKRKRGDDVEKVKNVIDEIADVTIIARQAQLIFGVEAVEDRIKFKLNRIKERLAEDKM